MQLVVTEYQVPEEILNIRNVYFKYASVIYIGSHGKLVIALPPQIISIPLLPIDIGRQLVDNFKNIFAKFPTHMLSDINFIIRFNSTRVGAYAFYRSSPCLNAQFKKLKFLF